MTDKPTSDNRCGGKLSALERERHCREIFRLEEYDGKMILQPFEEYFPLVMPGDTPKNINYKSVEQWEFWALYVTLGMDDEEGEILMSRDPKETLTLMVIFDILPENFTDDDLEQFFSERAVIASWFGLEGFAKTEHVPLGASFWWAKYVLHPNDHFYNPVQLCGLLIAANVLPRNFSEKELIHCILIRKQIALALEGIGNNRFTRWELTPEGVEAAEQMGLLDAVSKTNMESDDEVDVGAIRIIDVEPIKATSGKGMRHEKRGKGGNTPKNIWRKKMVKVCIDAGLQGIKDIQDAINTYRDDETVTDDSGHIIDHVQYPDIRHDKDYIEDGRFAAYLKKKKIDCGKDAQMKAFKKWVRNTFKQ